MAERHAVEEPQRAHRLVQRRPRNPGRDEMHLEGADVLQAKPVRRSAEMAGKLRHRVHVGSLRGRRQIADRHVLDHAPAKRAQLGHLIAPVLKIALQQPQSFKTEASTANRPAKCRVSGFVQSLKQDQDRCKPTTAHKRSNFHPTAWKGGCQCGAVRYVLHAPPLTLYACHCKECQLQSSSAFGLSMRVRAASVEMNGHTKITGRADPSSPPVAGVFCPKCGTRLGIGAKDEIRSILRPELLDNTHWIVPIGHLWTRSAQAGFAPPPGPLVYETQPETFDADRLPHGQ